MASLFKLCKSIRNSPSKRWGHVSWLDGNQLVYYVGGGYSYQEQGLHDLWAYHFRKKLWFRIEKEDIWYRCFAVTLNLKSFNEVVIYGGKFPEDKRINFAEFVSVSPKSINVITGHGLPLLRRNHAGCIYDQRYLIYHGGLIDSDLTGSLDIYDYETKTKVPWKYTKIEYKQEIERRKVQLHSIDASKNSLIITGGTDFSHSKIFSYLTVLSMRDLTITKISYLDLPPRVSRWGHSTCLVQNKLYIFSGLNENFEDDGLIQSINLNFPEKFMSSIEGHVNCGRGASHIFHEGVLITFGGFIRNSFSEKLHVKQIKVPQHLSDSLVHMNAQSFDKTRIKPSQQALTQIKCLRALSRKELFVKLYFESELSQKFNFCHIIYLFQYFSGIMHFRCVNQQYPLNKIDLFSLKLDSFIKLLRLCENKKINVEEFIGNGHLIQNLIDTAEFLCANEQLMKVINANQFQRLYAIYYIMLRIPEIRREFLPTLEPSQFTKELLDIVYVFSRDGDMGETTQIVMKAGLHRQWESTIERLSLLKQLMI